MNVRDLLIDAIEPLGYEGKVRLQGSYGPNEELPDRFVTYFIQSSGDQSFYDKKPMLSSTSISVVFYSKQMSFINSEPSKIDDALKAVGFTRNGPGRDVAFNTEHYAWQVEYLYLERNE